VEAQINNRYNTLLARPSYHRRCPANSCQAQIGQDEGRRGFPDVGPGNKLTSCRSRKMGKGKGKAVGSAAGRRKEMPNKEK